MSTEHTDLPLTEGQAKLLSEFEAACVRANREREVALVMVLAGLGIQNAHVLGFDFEARTMRIAAPKVEQPDIPHIGAAGP